MILWCFIVEKNTAVFTLKKKIQSSKPEQIQAEIVGFLVDHFGLRSRFASWHIWGWGPGDDEEEKEVTARPCRPNRVGMSTGQLWWVVTSSRKMNWLTLAFFFFLKTNLGCSKCMNWLMILRKCLNIWEARVWEITKSWWNMMMKHDDETSWWIMILKSLHWWRCFAISSLVCLADIVKLSREPKETQRF